VVKGGEGDVSDPDPICLLYPDPAADEISSKSRKNSYHVEFFDKFEKIFLLAYLNFRVQI
jgi:hypothetical protein